MLGTYEYIIIEYNTFMNKKTWLTNVVIEGEEMIAMCANTIRLDY